MNTMLPTEVLQAMLADEIADVARLLQEYAADDSPTTRMLIARIAECSMGPNHLWQDLGLTDRAELNTLMQRHFPALKARNSQNMRWKKFLYREICERAQVLICKSPHCESCEEVSVCFAPEV
ncbi:nitrogen fixation protein NifQ [Aquabacterium sp.]|mgnify:FL=1|uniref:nitrogen fixation protein NifQ n=1 Tax=Aquabacterium sp. TaxID=1872578 RepID=UPI0035B339AB